VSASNNVSLKVAGRFKYSLPAWKLITTDIKIVDMVQHCHLEFIETPSQQYNFPPNRFNPKEAKIIDDEIKTSYRKGLLRKPCPLKTKLFPMYFLGKRRMAGTG